MIKTDDFIQLLKDDNTEELYNIWYNPQWSINIDFERVYTAVNTLNNRSINSILGHMYEIGEGCDKNYSKAFHYRQLSADQNDSDGQVNLGNMYFTGIGCGRDYIKAVNYYQLSADQNNCYGQVNLGFMYANGKGCEQDYIKAVHHYQLSADQNNYLGQIHLGTMYFYGRGCKQDYIKAFHYYQLSADQGDDNAQSNLEIVMAKSEVQKHIYDEYRKSIAKNVDLKSKNDSLESENDDLKSENIELKYMPGGVGYQEALDDFQKNLINNNPQ